MENYTENFKNSIKKEKWMGVNINKNNGSTNTKIYDKLIKTYNL